MISFAPKLAALESLSRHLSSAPGVTAVTIGSGRRVISYGTPVGEPRAEWSVGSGFKVRVWGDESPLLDAMLELARLVDLREQEIDELAEALTQANDRQLRLFELSRLNIDTLDRTSTIDRVFRHGVELTESQHAVLVGDDGTAVWHDDDNVARPDWLVDLGVAALEGGNIRRPVSLEGKHALLVRVPVSGQNYVFALGRERGPAFGTAERKIIDALAGSLGSSLQLVSMHETALHRAIVENEHETATRLATAVLPHMLPELAGVDVYATTIPARAVGGDYYTAVLHGDTLRFAVGDVAGKGLPAAVLMTNAITSTNYVFSRSEKSDPLDLLRDVHSALDALLVGTNRFVTMCVGTAQRDPRDPRQVIVSLANAGHSPVLIVEDDNVISVPPVAPPVGVGSTPTGSSYTATLRRGDVLLIGSDGLLEQDDDDGDLFGHDRLTRLARSGASAAELAREILLAVRTHAGDRPRADDQTVFALRPHPGEVL